MSEERRQGNRAFVIAVVALVATVGAAGWFGYSWWHNGQADVQRNSARAAALEAGSREIATFTTLDHRNVEQGFNSWLNSSTGTLHDELVQNAGQGKQSIAGAGTTTTGQVLDAAVTELDMSKGTAKLIASVQTVVTPDGGAATTKRNRFQAELSKSADGWKLESLGQVPVSAS